MVSGGKKMIINDPYFRVEILSKTERPNLLSYLALHQCYAEKATADDLSKYSALSEEELGNRVVNKCLKFGHYSVIEHPTISFNIIGFPHNVMVQMTRHRHLSFSVQSQRYTGMRISQLANSFYNNAKNQSIEPYQIEKFLVEKVFYFRPVGEYFDREGNKYVYTESERERDFNNCTRLVMDYDDKIKSGFAPEHARDFLPQNIRQDFVVTMNARSLLHFCDLRLPKDAQPEIRTMAQMLFEKFEQWMPEVAEHYRKTRFGKNKLSP